MQKSDSRDRRPICAWIVLGVLAATCFCLSYTSLIQKSVTVDEFGHLPVGVNVLSTGDFRYCKLNPPLMNVLSAVPLVFSRVDPSFTARVPPSIPHAFWENGDAFMEHNRTDYHSIFVAGRLVTVFFTILLGLLAFLWARMLAPERPNLAGLLAAGLIWFSPNILAHGRLATTDLGLSFFMILSAFTFYLFVRRPTILRAASSGIALGLAQLVKFTAVYLYPALFIAIVFYLRGKPRTKRRRFILLAFVIFALSLVVINAGYGFQGSGMAVNDYLFRSSKMGWLQETLPPWTPMLLPEDYVRALDQQLFDVGRGDPSFLLGESYEGGRWYYFLVLLAIKLPLPLLLLALVALVVRISRKSVPRTDELLLLLPAVLGLIALSLFSNKQIGLRMILPLIPALALWIGANLAPAFAARRVIACACVLLGWFAFESSNIYPNYLTYFNQVAGGPSRGHLYALDSNLDWGQDLPKLKQYLEEQDRDVVQLLYFGRVDPAIYGITYEVPSGRPGPGVFAISRSLYGRGYFLYDHGRTTWGGPFVVGSEPGVRKVTTLGNTVDIFRIESSARE